MSSTPDRRRETIASQKIVASFSSEVLDCWCLIRSVFLVRSVLNRCACSHTGQLNAKNIKIFLDLEPRGKRPFVYHRVQVRFTDMP